MSGLLIGAGQGRRPVTAVGYRGLDGLAPVWLVLPVAWLFVGWRAHP